MKKILSLLGVIALAGSSSLSLVACGTNSPQPKDDSDIINSNIKTWTKQISIIPKSLLISNTKTINTNNLLIDTLNNNKTNIFYNKTNPTAGDSYTNFTKTWGYQGNITGFDEKKFINNSNSEATDNTVNGYSNKISNLNRALKQYAPLLESNTTLKTLLPVAKDKITDLMLKNIANNNGTIPAILNSVNSVFSSLKVFDPKNDLIVNTINYYKNGADEADSINKSIFDNDAWFKNSDYENTSEAEQKNKSIFDKDHIKTWDAFFMAKSSMDLNQLLKENSRDSKTWFGDTISKLFTYDATTHEIDGFDISKLGTLLPELTTTFSNITQKPDQLIKLINILVPFIKWKILGFSPTQPLTSIVAGTTATNVNTGILNINDVFKNLKTILTDSDSFVNFISSIIGLKSTTDQGIFSDFVITTNDKAKAVNNIYSVINEKNYSPLITSALKEVFTLINTIINDPSNPNIFGFLNSFITAFTKDTTLNFNIAALASSITDLINKLMPVINEIQGYTSKDEITTNWDKIWGELGLQKEGNDFKPDSVLAILSKILTENVTPFSQILTDISNSFTEFNQTYVYAPAEKEINANDWTTTVTKSHFDKNANTTTITYTLKDKNNYTYQIITVIAGDCRQQITKTHKIWVKSFKNV